MGVRSKKNRLELGFCGGLFGGKQPAQGIRKQRSGSLTAVTATGQFKVVLVAGKLKGGIQVAIGQRPMPKKIIS